MSKDIKKALEHCIEWNCIDCPNREELGSGETVCRGRLLPEVLEYVADLESKLAEMQNEKDELISKYRYWKGECAELKQQLAEKEKEIEKLNACVDFYKSYYISFKDMVIDELEKVKENIKKVPITDYDLSGNFEKMYKQDVIRQIDNQIKQLKGEKE